MLVSRVDVQPGQSQRDVQGRRYTAYGLISHCFDGTHLVSHRRYSHFLVLHEQSYACCGLPKAFRLSASSSTSGGIFPVTRRTLLQEYLNMLIHKARGFSFPTLMAFLRAPPYAAMGVIHTAPAAIHSATAAQVLAFLRGQQNQPVRRCQCVRPP